MNSFNRKTENKFKWIEFSMDKVIFTEGLP